jgi:hypothetical protein
MDLKSLPISLEYIDPPNKLEIITALRDLKDKADESGIRNLIEKIFPGWLKCVLDKYSDDYPHLSVNWRKICDLAKTVPKKIVLVDKIFFDDDHTILRVFCEIMTFFGYVVRRIDEFGVCNKCNAAIPSINLYNAIKEKGIQVPNNWSSKCCTCK